MKVRLALALILLPAICTAQEVVFEGVPVKRVSMGPDTVIVEQLSPAAADSFHVRIVRRDGKLFWATREMTEVVAVESGVFRSYIARNGSGYVRTLIPGLEDVYYMDEHTGPPGYVEHLTTMFGSLTYYGRRSHPETDFGSCVTACAAVVPDLSGTGL